MTTTVAAVQIGPCSDSIEENVDHGVELVRKAASQGATLVALPEMFNTTFFAVETLEHFDNFFETIPGPTTGRLCQVAEECGVGVIAGLSEKVLGGQYYNSAVLIDSKGEVVGTYRKTHLPLMVAPAERATYERCYFTPGDLGLPVFEIDGIRVGVLICYDRHFPEAFRTLVARGAEMIVIPTGARTWNTSWRSGIWESLLRTRAYENGVFIVAANRAGTERGTTYLGDSMIVSPKGTIVSRSDPEAVDDVVIAECDRQEVVTVREVTPFRRDLRPEIY